MTNNERRRDNNDSKDNDDDEVELQGSFSFLLCNYRILDKANDNNNNNKLDFGSTKSLLPTKISIINVFGKFLVGPARKNRTSLLEGKEKTLLDYRILEVDIRHHHSHQNHQ